MAITSLQSLLLLALIGLATSSTYYSSEESFIDELGGNVVDGNAGSKKIIDFVPKYSINKQYSYKYDSQLASSLTQADQFAVSRLRADVQLQFIDGDGGEKGEKTAVVTCEQIQLAMAQHPSFRPQLKPAMEEFENLERKEIGQSLQNTLQLPFLVKFSKEGKITQLQFHRDDQNWSENIKRSMINTLQVQEKKQKQQKDERTNKQPKRQLHGEDSSEQPEDDRSFKAPISFSQMEQTIEGECEMAYTVISNAGRRGRKSSSVNVTKSVNFHKCLRRPELRYSFHRNSEEFLPTEGGRQQPTQKQPVYVSTIYETEVGEPRLTTDVFEQEFVVLRSQVISRLSHDLLDRDHTAMITFANAQMILTNIESKAASVEWPTPSPLKDNKESLLHSLKSDLLHEQFIMNGDASYMQQTSNAYPSTENLPETAVNTMRALMESVGVGADKGKRLEMTEESTQHLEHFVGLIRMADKNQLKEIRQKLAPLVQMNTDSSYRNSKFIRDMFVDSLTISCTLPALESFASLIQSGHVTKSKAARSLQNLHQCRMVGDKQLEIMWKLCGSPLSKQHPPLHQSCLLSWGAMVNSACASNRVNISVVVGYGAEQKRLYGANAMLGGHSDSDKWAIEQTKQQEQVDWKPNGPADADFFCTKEKKRELVDKVINLYNRAREEEVEVKITVLKTLGNMGVTTSVIELEKIIQSSNEQPLIRIQAIDALRLIAHQVPHKIQRVLLPLFQDRSEKTEIRLNALYQLLHSQPERTVMDVICSQMSEETNMHVKSFLQSAIKEMIDSRSHFDQQTANSLKAALLRLKLWNALDEEAESRSASKLHQMTWFSGNPSTQSPQSQNGIGMTFGAIFGRSSHLPKELMASVDKLIDGRLFHDSLQVGVHQQDIEAAMQQIADAIDAKSFDQVIVRSKRTAQPQQQPSAFSSYNPYQLIKSFINKNKLFGASANQPDAKHPQLLIYTRRNGMDTRFVLFNQHSLTSIVRNGGKLDVTQLESSSNATDQLHHHYAAEMGAEWKVKAPTVAGIPLILTGKQPTISACEGMTRLEFEPFGSEKIRGARLTMNMQPQVVSACAQTMEAFSPMFTSGVQTRYAVSAKLPLNFQAKISAESAGSPIAELEVHLPTKDTTLLHLSTRPSTFHRTWPIAEKDGKSDSFVERSEKTLFIQSLEENHQDRKFETKCTMSGLHYQLRGHWPSGVLTPGYGVDWLLAGENSAEFRILPSKSPLAAKRLRMKFALRTQSTDKTLEKDKLMKIFDTRPELFADSQPEQVSSLRQFLQSFAPRMNIMARAKMSIEAEQCPQERKLEVESNGFCDQREIICLYDFMGSYKQSQASSSIDESVPSKAGRGRRAIEMKETDAGQITVRGAYQIARPKLQGLYPGGIQSQHILFKMEGQRQVSIAGAPQQPPTILTINAYAKPSKRQAKEWDNLLEQAHNSGIDTVYGDNAGQSRVRIPPFLMANDIIAIAEYQSPVSPKELMKQGYYGIKSLPQTSVSIKHSLEDTLWAPTDPSAQLTEHRIVYGRAILDNHPTQPQMKLWNLTISDEPQAIGGGNVKMVKGKSVPSKDNGNHMRVSNWNEEDGSQGFEGKKNGFGQRLPATVSLMDTFMDQSPDAYTECKMDGGRRVKSFDGQSYVIPLTSCYTILAKDCSSTTPSFVVEAKKSSNNLIHLRLLLSESNRVFQMKAATPTTAQSSKLSILMNDRPLSEDEFEEQGIRTYRLTPTANLTYVLHCAETGAEVEFDGSRIKVRLANKYVNKQCGVCGHFNLDAGDELMTRAGGVRKQASNLRDFHAAYLGEDKSQGECDPKSVIQRIKAGNAPQSNENGDEDAYTFGNSHIDRQMQKWKQQSEESSAEVQRQMEEEEKEAEKAKAKAKLAMEGKRAKDLEQKKKAKRPQFDDSSDSVAPGVKSWEDGFARPSSNEIEGQQQPMWSEEPEEEPKEEYDQQQSNELNESGGNKERQVLTPRLTTKVIEKRDRICFSKQPVRQCPEFSRPRYASASDNGSGSIPKSEEKKQIEFLCVPRYSVQAKRMMQAKRESETGRIAVSLGNHLLSEEDMEQVPSSTIKQEVMVPKECVVY